MGFWKRIAGLFNNGGLDSLDTIDLAPQVSPAEIAVVLDKSARDNGLPTIETICNGPEVLANLNGPLIYTNDPVVAIKPDDPLPEAKQEPSDEPPSWFKSMPRVTFKKITLDRSAIKLPKVLQFRVTSKDIREGFHSDPHICPVANAVRRKLGLKITEVCVTDVHVLLFLPTSSQPTGYSNTKKLSSYIKAFDRGKKIKPETFTLRLAK